MSVFGNGFHLVRRQALLFLAGAVVVASVVVGAAWLIDYLRDRQLDESSRGAQILSYLLAEDVDRSLDSVAASVSVVVDRLQSGRPQSGGDLQSLAADKSFAAFARQRLALESLLGGFSVIGAGGDLYYASHPVALYDSRMSGGYLDALRAAQPDAAFVSAPLENLNALPGVGVSKRIAAADGTFLGVASAFIKPSAFEETFAKSVLGRGGTITLLRSDGAMMARVPAVELMYGKDGTNSEAYKQFVALRRDGVTHEKSPIDGGDRIFAVSQAPGFPVAIIVAVATDEALAEWLRQAEWIAGGALLLVLAIIAGVFKLAGRINRLAEERQHGAVQAQLAIQYDRFNNAIHNIAQGLVMYDAKHKLIACNKRYIEIYKLPPELARPGTTQERILARQGVAKSSSAPREEPDGSVTVIDELADGRVILQRSKTLADGGWVSTHEDITARRLAEAKIEEMATKDALTGLSNRFDFKQRLNQCLGEVRRRNGRFAVFYLDLDHFKTINDTLGHPVGDKLLQQVGARIAAAVRLEDVVARLGGDEFAVIQRVTRAIADPMRLAERLIATIREPYEIDGAPIVIGTSVGISLTPSDSLDADELIRNADMALYQSKARGRGGYNFFEASMDEQVRARRRLEDDLREALNENQFQLHFQPVVSTLDRQVNSFEALLRWSHPTRGNVPPVEFIAVAEEIGLIVSIGAWVVYEACRQAARWPAHIRVAVNVSAVQFASPGLVETISGAIEEFGLDSSRLIVEVTESVMIKDAEQATSVLQALRELGVGIAMDDFGTGYSSLSYLLRFRFDKIKIDRSFVAGLGETENAAEIIRATTSMARALGIVSVAEGVETEDQFSRLAAEGCDEIQGYLTGRPMPASEVRTFLGASPQARGGAQASVSADGFIAASAGAEKAKVKVEFAGNLPRVSPVQRDPAGPPSRPPRPRGLPQ